MTLYYKEETKDVNGLPGYRYWGTNETLPGDGCYCVGDVCAPSGETLDTQVRERVNARVGGRIVGWAGCLLFHWICVYMLVDLIIHLVFYKA